MINFYSRIDSTVTNLVGATKKTLQFNTNMEAVPATQPLRENALSVDQVLTNIYNSLKWELEHYALDETRLTKLSNAIFNYKDTAPPNSTIQKTDDFKKILKQNSKLLLKENNYLKKLENILLNPPNSRVDYDFLCNLALYFSFTFSRLAHFSKEISLIQKVNRIQETIQSNLITCTRVFRRKNPTGEDTRVYILPHIPNLEDSEDLALFYQFSFLHEKHHSDLFNKEFVLKLINQKYRTKNERFKEFLELSIKFSKITELETQWHRLLYEEPPQITACEEASLTLKPNSELIGLIGSFFRGIENFQTEFTTSHYLIPSSEEEAQERFEDFIEMTNRSEKLIKKYEKENISHSELTKWYTEIYNKIKEYEKTFNINKKSSFFEPGDFINFSRLSYSDNILTPFAEEIKKLEKQVEKQLTKEAKEKFVHLEEQKNSLSEDTPLIIPEELTPIAPVAVEKKQLTLEEFHKACNEESPFDLDPRITSWYHPETDLQQQAKSSIRAHRPPLATTLLLWKYGLHYERLHHDTKKPQSAFIVLTQQIFTDPSKKRLPLYSRPSQITATCTSLKSKNANERLLCYHLNHTFQNQQEAVVKEYIEASKSECIEFPSLAGSNSSLEISEDLNKKFIDGSYIESTLSNENSITVRDPKSDKEGLECRIKVFILPSKNRTETASSSTVSYAKVAKAGL